MKPSENIPPVEPAPETAAPVVETTEPGLPPKPKPAWVRKTLIWIAVILGVFLVGLGVEYFLLAKPQAQRISNLQADIAGANSKIETLQQEALTLNQNLNDAQTALQSAQERSARAARDAALYRLQSDVNQARIAALKLDVITCRQAVQYALTSLDQLLAADPSINNGEDLKARLELAGKDLAENNLDSALGELDNLANNLLLLRQNLAP